MAKYIQTDRGITLILKGKPYTVSQGDAQYDALVAAVKAGETEDHLLELLTAELRKMEEAVAKTHVITDAISISGGEVRYKNGPVHNSLTTRMLRMLEEGFNLLPMARFLENLMENPSYRAVNDLYAFLEHGSMPITEDGCFLAYKAVREDFMDIHSGTFRNMVGDVCEMPRNRVDEDPTRTCSAGLHVCSFEYLPHFSHANGHVMVCKVNPRDVVAIPTDYNNTKMRVCRYEVLEEYPNYYGEREDRLSKVTVHVSDQAFSVRVEYSDYVDTEGFDLLSEAAARAEELMGDSDVRSVTVLNTATETVLFEKVNPDFIDNDDDGDYLGDTDPTFEVIKISEEGGDEEVIESDIDNEYDAKQVAIDVDTPYFKVLVRNEDTGEVVLTLS